MFRDVPLSAAPAVAGRSLQRGRREDLDLQQNRMAMPGRPRGRQESLDEKKPADFEVSGLFLYN
jgi:hypothetical protein